MTNKTKSVFRKVIEEKQSDGSLKKQYTIDLQPWEFTPENSTQTYKGFTTRLDVLKLSGDSPSNKFINIDPSNKELREAIGQMYKAYDEVVKK